MKFLSTLSPRLKIGLTAIAAILAFEYILTPLARWQQDTVTQVAQLQESVARKQALVGRQAEIELAGQEAEKRLAEARKYFPPEPVDAPALQLDLQKQVEALVASLGAKVENVDWLPPAGSALLVRAPVRFRLEIEPRPLMHLVHALETDPRLVGIDRLNLTARSRSTALIADLDITAYGVGRKE